MVVQGQTTSAGKAVNYEAIKKKAAGRPLDYHLLTKQPEIAIEQVGDFFLNDTGEESPFIPSIAAPIG